MRLGRWLSPTARWKAKQSTAGTPEALQNPTAVANGWLDEASARVNAAEQADTNEESPVSVSRLPLFHRFRRRSAKAVRIGFYAAPLFLRFRAVSADSAGQRQGAKSQAWSASLVKQPRQTSREPSASAVA